jgi:hypothetical protein
MAYGTVNADVIGTSVAGSNLGAGNASIMKNRIINGAMVIDQRNAGASVTATSAYTYTVDRFANYGTIASKFTSQQNAGSVTPPVGFTNYLGNTSSSAYSVGASETFIISQAIEGFNTADLGWGTANAKTVTLSAWVYSSLTGTFGGALQNSAGNRSYPFSYTIPVANTWTSISVTIAGDTTGTLIGATNGIGIRLVFSMGTGSSISGTAGSWAGSGYFSATGATSVVGTNGATFYITGVQLEVGSSATGFEYRQYGTELNLCQRYFSKTQGVASSAFSSGLNYTSALVLHYVKYPVTMRTAPTFSYSGALSDFAYISNINAAPTSFTATTNTDTARFEAGGVSLQVAAASILQFNTTTGAINFSAEL